MLSAGIELALAAESRGATWEERAVNRFEAFARVVADLAVGAAGVKPARGHDETAGALVKVVW